MLFNSYVFACFLPLALGVLFVLPARWQKGWLLAASLFFYSWGSVRDLPLLLLVIVWTYWCSLGFVRTRREVWSWLGIVGPIALLGAYKYGDFVLGALGEGVRTGLPLPVGVSFFTFKAISFIVGVGRRSVAPMPSLGRYALFVSFFPPLVAGPIMRPEQLLPQLGGRFKFSAENVGEGLRWMLWGLFKKVAVADVVAPYVNAVYAPGVEPGGPAVVTATLLFAIQIYGDFSGYSDMAYGAARTLGIDLVRNFRTPYFASSMTDFWRRWHVSLSTWFRDYVYVPLGGGRAGRAKVAANLLVTFGLSGLWHGANWTFVIWGIYHGALVALEHVVRPWTPPRWLGPIYVLPAVGFGWLIFRADSLAHVARLLDQAPRGWADPAAALRIAASSPLTGILGAGLVATLQTVGRGDGPEFFDRVGAARWALALILLFWIVIFGAYGGDAFLYFQF